LQFSFIKYIEKYIKDLQYMLLVQIKSSQNISKTIIYIDNINKINKIYKYIRQ